MRLLTAISIIFCLLTTSPLFGQSDSITISGKIKNQICDSITVSNNIIERVIKLDSNGVFSKKVLVKDGYYYIQHGNSYASTFLRQSDSLFLTLDNNHFDESTVFTGSNSITNTYLLKKYLFKMKFMYIANPMTLSRLEESKFLRVSDSLEQLQLNFLLNYKGLPLEFIKIEKKTIWSEKLNNIARLESLKRYVSDDKEYKVSSNYPNFEDSLELNDEELMLNIQYSLYMNNVLARQFRNTRDTTDKRDYMIQFLDYVDSRIPNKTIRDEFLMSAYPVHSKQTRTPHNYHKRFLKSLTKSEYMDIATTRYIKGNKLKKWDKAPDFAFTNSKGDTIHLSDFKGKLVYIDIWATWCQPCIREIPYLKALEEEFKDSNIVFISISKGDNRKDWLKFVKKEKGGGIHLFSENKNVPFFTDFFVTGIPRFILINENGLVIDPDAERPSINELEGRLKDILDEMDN